MKEHVGPAIKAHFLRGAFYLVLLLAGTLLAFLPLKAKAKSDQRTLTFAERVSYQRAVEEVYWRHRIWPKENRDPKPSLDAVMSQAQLEKKVEDYLRNSQVLEDHYKKPLSADQLQAEIDRMAQHTKQPDVLHELFDALGNDPFLIAECLARPVLSERLVTSFARERPKGSLVLSEVGANSQTPKVILANATYTLPTISDAATECTPDTWTSTSTINAPGARFGHTAVWTGTEMIVWGGNDGTNKDLISGGRYDPGSDSWTATSKTNAPGARAGHTAVWTGSEMIVWGGYSEEFGVLNTGGRYNPDTDSWTATSIVNTPDARVSHRAVWTGSEMIVWGGVGSDFFGIDTGGRYNPSGDTWTATSTTSVPSARSLHTAVWTGSEMIVWGGDGEGIFNTGGRYNPRTDTWTATTTTNAPEQRALHTAVWTGTEMIVWGGTPDLFDVALRTGGIYNPRTDSWRATNIHDAPDSRELHTALWTGSEMIVWGGVSGVFPHGSRNFNTGARYNPSINSWTATTTTNAPDARIDHTAVWTGSEMIVWGGEGTTRFINTGGRYCAPRPIP